MENDISVTLWSLPPFVYVEATVPTAWMTQSQLFLSYWVAAHLPDQGKSESPQSPTASPHSRPQAWFRHSRASPSWIIVHQLQTFCSLLRNITWRTTPNHLKQYETVFIRHTNRKMLELKVTSFIVLCTNMTFVSRSFKEHLIPHLFLGFKIAHHDPLVSLQQAWHYNDPQNKKVAKGVLHTTVFLLPLKLHL